MANHAVLYDVEWQILRCRMLSVNNDYGGWWTVYGVEKNLSLCGEYIDEAWTQVETQIRLWRVKNLLNATLLGYGQRADVTDAMRDEVIIWRDACSFDSAMVVKANNSWDWEAVRREVTDMSISDRKMVLDNLRKRVKTSAKRNGEENKFKFRNDLERFVNMLEQ